MDKVENIFETEVFMDYNDFEGQQYTFDRGTYYSSPRWNDFTLDDERRAKRRFSRFLLSTTIYLIIAYAVAIGISLLLELLLGESKYVDLVHTSWFSLVFNSIVMYVIAFPVFYFMIRGMKNAIRFKETISLKEFIKIFLVGQAFMYVGSFIGNYLNIFIGAFTGKVPENTTSEAILASNIWLVILVVAILGPIVEELMFRKLLMDKLGIYGDRVAIFVSAIAFGFFHGNLYQFFYAAMLGFVLAYLYSKTSNVWYPIALHMLINFIGSVIPMLLSDKITRYEEILLLASDGAELTPELTEEFNSLVAVVGAYSIFTIGLVVAGLIIFFKQRKQIFVSDRAEIAIPKERRVSVILLNVGAISYIVVSAILMFLSVLVG